MANFIESALEDVGAFITRIGHDLFGSGSSVPTNGQVSDLRFEGMDNAQLAAYVNQLNAGPGPSATSSAADALANIAQSLQQIDQTLQQQLQAIGVNWQSSAADLAQEMTTTASAYGGSASDAGTQAGTSVGNQGDAYSSAKHASATPADLQPFAQNAGIQSLTGHATDLTSQMKEGAAARNQTVDALNNYKQTSQSNLDSYQPLPAPPSVTLGSAPPAGSAGGVTSVSSFTPGGAPAGTVAPTANTSFLPGSSSGVPGGTQPIFPGLGAPGGNTPAPNAPVPPGSLPPSLGPGPSTGIGNLPGVSAMNTAQAAQAAGNAFEGLVEDASIGAGIAGGGVAAGLAATAGRERMNRNGPSTGGAFGEDETNPPVNRALAELDAEEAAAAKAATGEPMLMEPAVGGRRGEDDQEHHSRYVVQADDVFGDPRMVTPAVLGEQPAPQSAPQPGFRSPARDFSDELRLGQPDPNERD